MSAVNELVITPEFVTNIIAVDLADETTFTTADKAKLNGIEAGAQVNTVTRVAGKTGVVDLNAGDIGYDGSTAYGSGTVGKELSDLNRQLSDLEDTVSTTQIINSASGAIASFADGADEQPIRKLVANIEPVQDLHGYDNPWPAGGGKNKLPNIFTGKTESGITFTVNSDGTVVATGTATGRVSLSAIVNADENLVDGTSYILSGCPAGGSKTTFQAAIFTTPSYSTQAKDLGNGVTFKYVKTSGDSFMVALYVESGYACPPGGLVFKPMIRLATETDATFAPYSNICPISGHTGMEIEQRGKNLIDIADITMQTEGYIINQTVDFPSGQYVLSYYSTTPNNRGVMIAIGKDDQPCAVSLTSSGSRIIATFNAPNGIKSIRVYNGAATYTNFQLELGSTATAFKPYTGNQISITFPSSAGTVYGGTLDVTNGVLTVDRAFLDTQSNRWALQSINSYGIANFSYYKALPYEYDFSYKGISNVLPYQTTTIGNTQTEGYTVIESGGTVYVRLNSDKASTVKQFKEWSTANNLQILLKLANPITYQLTESEVSGILETLYGTNNIWTDVGTVDVEYPADTRLFIEQLTKPTEDDMTADHAISAGTFFMIGNTLYLATAQIAAGATITPGTNATKLSLADALNQLNT